MKICFFSGIHDRGDPRVFQKEARTLATANLGEVVYVCRGQGAPFMEDKVKIVPYGFTYARENARTSWGKFKRLWSRCMALPRLYKVGVAQKADVYHCNNPEAWVIGLLVARKNKAVCIFDAHEDYSSTFTKNYLSPKYERLIEKIMGKVFAWLCKRTDYIIIAKRTIDDQFPMPKGRKICVNNYAPLSTLERFTPRSTPRTAEDPLLLVHSGNVSVARGWPQMLEALAKTRRKDIYLHLFGAFMDGTEEDFHRRTRELGLEDRVKVTGWVTHEQSYEFISEGHVGLMVLQGDVRNHVYAMPNKMFDYMVLGLPYVGPDFAIEVAEITRASEGGILLNPANVSALAASFDYFADHEEERQMMGQKGRDAVMQTYNWEADSAKMVELYRQIARDRQRR